MEEKKSGAVPHLDINVLKNLSGMLNMRPVSLSSSINIFKKRTKAPGLAPGILEFVGEKKVDKPIIHLFEYNERNLIEKDIDDLQELSGRNKTDSVTWVNVRGIHDEKVIEQLGNIFDVHPLAMEDLMNTSQRPKIDEYQDHVFIVMKVFFFNAEKNSIEIEQISLVLGDNYVLSFQEGGMVIFNPLRERIRSGAGKHRKRGADYLVYSLIDTIVDLYFQILDVIGECIEKLEEDIEEDPREEILGEIKNLKKEMLLMRKLTMPVKDIIRELSRGDCEFVKEDQYIYFRDVLDHMEQVSDNIEMFRDMLSGIADHYLTFVSNKMNEVMKVLTIISTIFIPLTFIAGVYGMNFKFMPELSWKWSYPIVWTLMIAAGCVMAVFFRKKKWL